MDRQTISAGTRGNPVDRRAFLQGTGFGLFSMIVGGSLPGCGRSSGGLQELPVIVLAPPAGGGHLPLTIKAKEFDKKEGVNLKLEFRTDLAAYYNDLVSGQVPFNVAGAANVFGAMRVRGAPICITQSSCILGQVLAVPEGSAIKTTADLKGKRFGIDRASYTYAWMLRICREAKIDLEEDVTIVPGALPTLGLMLAKGDVDAAWLGTGFLEALMGQNPGKFKILYDMGEELARIIGVKRIYTLIGAREDFVQKNPALVEKMFVMWRNAADWANKNPQEMIDILAKPVDQGGNGLPRPALEAQLVKLKTLRYEIVPAVAIKDDLFKELQAYVDVKFLSKLPDQGIVWEGLKKLA